MLKTRIITALILLCLLVLVAFSGSFYAFAIVTTLFFAAAMWESFRLFGNRLPKAGAIIWTIAFGIIVFNQDRFAAPLLFAVCVAIWIVRLAPSLAMGLPATGSLSNRLLNGIYSIAILGCFVAILVLFQQSPLYLLSVMTIVWIADIGAYFAGKAFGRRKLAPSISPGKSWEGAIGGWLAVLAVCALTSQIPGLESTFAVKLQHQWGWMASALALSFIVAASIVGDLFESQLKRRAGMKDSSNLLPGHGGILDRIDALIPALPIAVFFQFWL